MTCNGPKRALLGSLAAQKKPNIIWLVRLSGTSGEPHGPQMGFIAQNGAPFGCPRSAYRSLNGPEHKIWIRLIRAKQPVEVGPKKLKCLPFAVLGPEKASGVVIIKT